MDPAHRVVVVGGGFSGCALVIQLLAQAGTRPLEITLVERSAELGQGVAYGTRDPEHLLNVPAAGMSLFPDQPRDFADWLESREQPAPSPFGPSSFVPRMIYAEYLRDCWDHAVGHAPATCSIAVLRDEAIAVRPGYRVLLRSGKEIPADAIAIATGHLPPRPPLGVASALAASPGRIIENPWGAEEAPPQGDVLLLGAGLTALDQILSLRRQGFAGVIHVLSRHGRLPLFHSPSPQPAPAPPIPPHAGLRGWLRLVRQMARSAPDWRGAIDSLRPHTSGIWCSLPDAEKRRFLRHVRSTWDRHRHRAAPQIQEILRDLTENGQVRVLAGRVTEISECPEGLDLLIRRREGGPPAHLRVARVVSCVGSDYDYARTSVPLISDLMRQGWARPSSVALGLDVSESGELLDRDGTPQPSLTTLGPPRIGRLWETIAVPELRVQAQALAGQILQSARFSLSARP